VILPDRVLVIGTDTDVGKTVVTAAIAAACGYRALKPIASGVPAGTVGDDAALLSVGDGHPPATCYRFVAPLSPHRAAALEDQAICLDTVLDWITANAGPKTLVEGVGGWRVPLGPGVALPDLATRLGWPVLVVARDALGALNHTLLTVDAVRADGLQVVGVVLNQGTGAPVVPSNLDDLQHLLPVPVRTFPACALSRADLAQAWSAGG
jgi:dethiobiotin synthase